MRNASVNNLKKLRTAFSMIELVFVIVILGIVASISSSTIVEIFKSYIPQKASALASEKTELAAMQISNRLSNSVPWSLTTHDNAGLKVPLTSPNVSTGDKIEPLEWIGIDNDGFSASNSWNGFCDTTNATATNCPTNGSNLAVPAGEAIIFKNPNDTFTTDDITTAADESLQYSPACMGIINTANRTCVTTTTASNGENLGMSAGRKLISEHYVLAWSAYAIVPENCVDRNGDGVQECDLALYYNYQPWNGDTMANGAKSILLNNVTLFKFAQYEDTIRFKICAQQTIGDNSIQPISVCKEKVVIR